VNGTGADVYPMPRGYGNLFPGWAGKRDQSRGGGLSSHAARAAQEEHNSPVFLADREDATLQWANYLFPCLSACGSPGTKLSLGLAANIAEKSLHRNMRRSRRVPWDFS